MKNKKAMNAIKRLGVFAVAACVFLGGAKTVYAEEANAAIAVAPEGYEVEVLEEVKVTETIQPMEASKDSGTYYNLSWSLANNKLSITGSGDMKEQYWADDYPWAKYRGEINEIEIGDFVTKIGKNAFYNMDNLQIVNIGKRVSYIGESAFNDCGNLLSVDIPASVVTIDNHAFRACANMVEVNFADNSKLTGIGNFAFQGCKNLISITLPNSLEYIGDTGFADCYNLVSVEFGTKLKTIYNYAFSACLKLVDVELPNSIRSIGEHAFYHCTSLVSVTIPYGVQEIGKNAFCECSALDGEVKVPGTVTKLGSGVFWKCGNLKSASVYAACDIPLDMFSECYSLSKVTIGNTVTGIGNYAFHNDKALKSITIPSGVTYIGESAFQNCEALATVTLSSNLTSIGESAFYNAGLTSIKMPNTVTSIGRCAFQSCGKLKTAVVSTGLTILPYRVFYKCHTLETVTLGNNINTIDYDAFSECFALKNINWPTNLNKIGDYAFYTNDALLKVELPASVNAIGDNAFGDCLMLNTVVTMGNITDVGREAFANCPSLITYKTYSENTYYNYAVFNGSPTTIYGWADSTAQTYAQNNNLAFQAITKLDTPVNKKIANVVKGPHIYWNAVQGASYYTVYRATSKTGKYTVLKSVVAPIHYVDTTAVSGKTYYYKVEAKNSKAKSDLSAAQGITYVGTPDITSRINKAAGIQLGWNKITGATGYAIYRKSYAGNDAWVRVATISGNSTFTWTDSSVKAKNGEIYKYTVRALAGSDKKTLSGCRNAGRTMVRLASRVLNSATKASATSIKCTWTTSSAVTGYEVRFMDGNKVVKTQTIGNCKTGTKTFTGLTKGKKYKVQVRSYKKVTGVGSFYSAWSAEKYVQL